MDSKHRRLHTVTNSAYYLLSIISRLIEKPDLYFKGIIGISYILVYCKSWV